MTLIKHKIICSAVSMALVNPVISLADNAVKPSPWSKVPDSIMDCVQTLEKILPPQTLDNLRISSDKDLYKFHMTIGLDIRNNWLYGHRNAALAQYFFNKGVHHPDDMSAIIIRCLRRDLRAEPLELEKLTGMVVSGEARQKDIVVESIEVPSSLSSVPLTTVDGKEVHLADSKGEITLISLVSARDSHNTSEIELLNLLRKHYPKGLRILVLIVSDNAQPEDREKLLNQLQKTHLTVIDGGPTLFRRNLTNVLLAPAVLEVPANIILGKDGNMVLRFNGWRKDTKKEISTWLSRLTRKI